jgi:hypothetical protein
MAKAEITYDEKVTLFDKLVATNPAIELKGDTVPYTSLNGHMFSYLSKDGQLALRLPEEARTAFLAKYKTGLMQAYGIVQKEYVVVPDTLLKKTGELKEYFDISHKYVSALKPKPTTRKKK